MICTAVQHAVVSSTAREESMQLIERHVEVLDASAMVYNMKSGINDLPLEIPRLVGILDDIARIHPSISSAYHALIYKPRTTFY